MSSTDRPHQETRTGARRATGLPGFTAALALSERVLQPAVPFMSDIYFPDSPIKINGQGPPPRYPFPPQPTCDLAQFDACVAQEDSKLAACEAAASSLAQIEACRNVFDRSVCSYAACTPGETCCAGVCCGGTCCRNDVCVQNVPIPPGFGGSQNLTLYSTDCQNIQGLTVQLSVSDALVPTPASNGFSLQVNGYAPLGPGLPCYGIDWLQYILYVQNGNAFAEIQYWNNEICAYTSPCNWTTLGLAGQCGAIQQNPWLPLGTGNVLFFQQLSPNNVPSSDIIPPRSVLEVALTTNAAGLVTDALFTITIDGAVSQASYSFPSTQQYGFPAFIPLVVASPSSQVNFTSGSGELTSSVSSGELCVQQEGSPGSLCGVTWGSGTEETSNTVYGDISPCCGQVLSQAVSTG